MTESHRLVESHIMPTESEIKIVLMEGAQTTEPEVEWTAENEVNLFYAMRGRRPVGMFHVFSCLALIDLILT